jgi:glycosyltransferase involved in cell wall biosynthesis
MSEKIGQMGDRATSGGHIRQDADMPSIVIPAHDEERAIGPLLAGLAPLAGRVEVVVVCNGCHDRTADAARSAAPWATVLELAEPSKPAALDAGDATATTFPRLYLDADVRVDADAVDQIFAAVSAERPAAAASPRYDVSQCSLLVRSHVRFWVKMPVNQQSISGTNAMAVSAAGRARFVNWPRLIGDDYFLDGLFTDAEKTRVPGAIVWRSTPRRFADCVSRSARIHQGNLDVRDAGLRSGHGGGGTGGMLAVVKADPAAVLDLPAHLCVAVATRVLAWWRRRRGTSQVWFRDASRV